MFGWRCGSTSFQVAACRTAGRGGYDGHEQITWPWLVGHAVLSGYGEDRGSTDAFQVVACHIMLAAARLRRLTPDPPVSGKGIIPALSHHSHFHLHGLDAASGRNSTRRERKLGAMRSPGTHCDGPTGQAVWASVVGRSPLC